MSSFSSLRCPLRFAVVILCFALSAGLAACGNEQSKTLNAENEGIYVDVGGLKYQVQISRQLNPRDPEDEEFLAGANDVLAEGEEWFAVFIRVENDSKEAANAATEYEIEDTQENVFHPLPISHEENPFAYEPKVLSAGSILPDPNEIAAQTSIGGQMLLFKVPRGSFENRPLELLIHDPNDSQLTGTVNLDV